MLKGIPDIISPELLKVIAEMGHGDTLVIGDCNFPASSMAKAKNHINIRCDGLKATAILDALLQLFPLDDFVEQPVALMQKADKNLPTPIWDEFSDIVSKYDKRGNNAIRFIDRFDFYEESRNAYAVVSTSEKALYGCIIIQKGCLL